MQGHKGFRNLLSLITKSDPSPLVDTELTQVIAVIKCENKRVLTVLSDRMSSLSQECIQV